MASVGGVMVSIDAFQALDPGSIPGHRSFLDDWLINVRLIVLNASK